MPINMEDVGCYFWSVVCATTINMKNFIGYGGIVCRKHLSYMDELCPLHSTCKCKNNKCSPFITLYLGSKGFDHVISE